MFLEVLIRRYFCRFCKRTISILPDELYPGRWFTAAAILVSLFLALILGVSAGEIRRRFGASGETPGWKTLRRWRRQLLNPLWGWFGKQLGIQGQAETAKEGARRLVRLIAQGGTDPPLDTKKVAQTAGQLLAGIVYSQGKGIPLNSTLSG